ncbi:Agenet-like domain [Dillenia turbinata]|uniref:Agenet-like domain n=1 Tax=Dillenia turbinata TaxID=194707 RepID=A0AAN8UYD6_9MAGN
MAFQGGQRVEVRVRTQNLSTLYYTAKIITVFSRNDYIVLYETRWKPYNSQQSLLDIVNEADIRPCPPTPEVIPIIYQNGDRVDVYYDGAWRIGTVISRVEPQYKYNVRLENSGFGLLSSFYRIRIHQEWINGSWITPAAPTLAMAGLLYPRQCHGGGSSWHVTLAPPQIHGLLLRVKGDDFKAQHFIYASVSGREVRLHHTC